MLYISIICIIILIMFKKIQHYIYIFLFIFLNFIFFNYFIFLYNFYFINYSIFLLPFYYITIFKYTIFLDFFSFILIILFIATIFFYSYIKYNKNNVYIFLSLLFSLFFLVSTHNIFIFFIFYELILIISYFLIICNLWNTKNKKISNYFLVWSQISSLIILFVICYIYIICDNFDFFFIKLYKFKVFEKIIIITFIFFGFGLKIPVWPFNFWIIKVYFEIPEYLTMFFSGFLSKIAILGFYKIFNLVNFYCIKNLFIIFIIFSIIDASIKMWNQISFKYLIIYSSIQEMNIIFFFFFYSSYFFFNFLMFIISHTLISSILFFILYFFKKYFFSEIIIHLNNVSNFSQTFFFVILFSSILFSGVPGTIKFYSEFIFLLNLCSYSFFIVFFVVLIFNYFSIISFNKFIFNILFGLKKNINIIELTWDEKILFYILFYLFFILIYINFFFI